MHSPLLFSTCLVLLYYKTAVAGTGCSDSATNAMQRLKRKLLCNYDSELRPVKHQSNVTEVEFFMTIHSLTLRDNIDILEIHSSEYLNWQDDHLTWERTEYSGIEKMLIVCSNIWVPDVGLTSGPTPSRPTGHCLVESDGKVEAGKPMVQMAKCVADITRWPFDIHTCVLRVGSWAFNSEQLVLSKFEEGVTTLWYTANGHWVLRDYNVKPFKQKISGGKIRECLQYTFVVQRHPGGYAATILVPSIVFVTMTLASFWLEPQCKERLGLLRVNIACHCMYLIYLGMKLPENGDSTPFIMTFFRDSLLLTGISLLVSLSADRMNTAARAPPLWITFITDTMVTTRPGQLLLLGSTDVAATVEAGDTEDSDLRDVSTTSEKGWHLFAIIIDRLCFLAYLMTFFVLIGAFIPQSL